MSRYLVTLKPVEAFFFGGERTFEFYDENNKKELQNNIIKSSMFPQQTSVLGMLRKEILNIKKLIKEDWDYKDKDKIEKYIGPESFNIDKEEQDFGIIKEISPVFLAEIHNGKYNFIMKIPKDHNKANAHKVQLPINYRKKLVFNKVKLTKEVCRYVPLKFNEKDKCKCNFAKEKVYIPSNYISKKGISNDFVNIKNGEIIKNEDIFKIDNYIGIKLDDKKITKKDSLFRLVKYKLNCDYNKDIRFAFTVELDESGFEENEKIDGHKNVVSLGGEGSYFYINFKKIDYDIVEKIKFLKYNCKNEFYKKIVLLSDTYVSKEIYMKYCDYSIAESIDFRNIGRNSYKKIEGSYYKSFKRTNYKYSFLERGSVLFLRHDNYEEFLRSIDNKNLKKIGYNYLCMEDNKDE